MNDLRPNILHLMTDQQRGDCLGIEDHPVLQAPYLDNLAVTGVRFRRAYTACPVCIPARRTLMTGKNLSSHGVFMNYNTWLRGPHCRGSLPVQATKPIITLGDLSRNEIMPIESCLGDSIWVERPL